MNWESQLICTVNTILWSVSRTALALMWVSFLCQSLSFGTFVCNTSSSIQCITSTLWFDGARTRTHTHSWFHTKSSISVTILHSCRFISVMKPTDKFWYFPYKDVAVISFRCGSLTLYLWAFLTFLAWIFGLPFTFDLKSDYMATWHIQKIKCSHSMRAIASNERLISLTDWNAYLA